MILGSGHLSPLALSILFAGDIPATPAFSPASIFTGGAKGLWLDPSDISTGYQDSAGTTPQTASGQPTGLRLDKRLGVTALPVSGWSKNSGDGVVSVNGNQITITGATTTTRVDISLPGWSLTDWASLNITTDVSGATSPLIFLGGTPLTLTAGTKTYSAVIASSTLCRVQIDAGAVTFTVNSRAKYTGNHVSQSTGSARPEYDVLTGISSDYSDGSDDGYATKAFAAGTLTSGMDCFIAVNRASTGDMILCSEDASDASNYFGLIQSGNSTSGSAAAGVGSAWTCWVDGVQVGGTGTTTGAQLNTALGSGTYKVLEFRDLDLSAWTKFTVGLYASNMFGGDNAGLILPPAQDAATRTLIRKWLGAKVGLSL